MLESLTWPVSFATSAATLPGHRLPGGARDLLHDRDVEQRAVLAADDVVGLGHLRRELVRGDGVEVHDVVAEVLRGDAGGFGRRRRAGLRGLGRRAGLWPAGAQHDCRQDREAGSLDVHRVTALGSTSSDDHKPEEKGRLPNSRPQIGFPFFIGIAPLSLLVQDRFGQSARITRCGTACRVRSRPAPASRARG